MQATNNCSLKTRTSKLADAGSCERLRETFPQVREKRTKTSEDQRMKEGDRTNMQHTFFLSLPLSYSISLFLPLLLNPTTKPLLLVSDFYLVASGPRFISQSPLSFSLDSFFPPFLLTSSSSSLSLSPTNSPQPRTVRNFLFRILDPQARLLLPFFQFFFLLLFLWPPPVLLVPPPGPSYQRQLNLSHDFC